MSLDVGWGPEGLGENPFDFILPDNSAGNDTTSTWRWATVTSATDSSTGLRIRLDGDTAPLNATPWDLGGPRIVGDRVWVQRHARRVIVLGPNPKRSLTLPAAGNFNSYTTSGIWLSPAILDRWQNYPVNNQGWLEVVSTSGTNLVMQTFTTISGEIYTRTRRSDNVWNAWVYQGPPGGDLPGVIKLYAGLIAPTGHYLCDGSAKSRTTDVRLFSVIGTTYGAGDGSTTFNVPDLRGRVVVGVDSTQTEFANCGQTGGEKAHTLTTDEMPSHRHRIHYWNLILSQGGNTGNMAATGSGSQWRYGGEDSDYQNRMGGPVGGDTAHNNLQPYMALNYIIKR